MRSERWEPWCLLYPSANNLHQGLWRQIVPVEPLSPKETFLLVKASGDFWLLNWSFCISAVRARSWNSVSGILQWSHHPLSGQQMVYLTDGYNLVKVHPAMSRLKNHCSKLWQSFHIVIFSNIAFISCHVLFSIVITAACKDFVCAFLLISTLPCLIYSVNATVQHLWSQNCFHGDEWVMSQTLDCKTAEWIRQGD